MTRATRRARTALAALGLGAGLLTACPAPSVLPPPRRVPPSDSAEAPPLGKLPEDVRPLKYLLQLTLDPARERYQGVVVIDLELAKPRSVLWLHGHDLQVNEASYVAGGSPIRAQYQQVDAGGVARVTLPETVPAGKGSLRLAFSAAYDTHHAGLTRVSRGGAHYAFTQFEPVWARNAFPCFDEPRFKTPWSLWLTVPKGAVAIGNTRQTSRARLDPPAGTSDVPPTPAGMEDVQFAPTEPLPSYLVAFAVGPLDVVEAPPIPPNEVRKTPLPFRGIAAAGRGKELAYALAQTPRIVAWLEGYFGIPYPYDKLDILAVPDRSGAMENAGAITFREWLLLMDESASFDQRRSFAIVMAHELAHQWFGDLVTMPWWDDIWLNEAFATWMAYRAVQPLYPEYQAELVELAGTLDTMRTDSLASARQIRQPIGSLDDIHAAFDGITYRKGGAVLGMFESWVGREKFRDGLRAHLEAHAHGTATADDLLAALDAVAGKDKSVSAAFRTFLNQPGLPLVEVRPVCAKTGATVELTQQRYLPLGSGGDAAKSWHVPVCISHPSDALCSGPGHVGNPLHCTPGTSCVLLDSTARSLPVHVSDDPASCPTWLLPNVSSDGYYAWSMPREWLVKLAAHEHLSTRERMGVARAIRAAYAAGTTDGKAALETSLMFVHDPHSEVATAATSYFYDALRWLEGDPLEAKVRARARAVFRPIFDKLAAKKDDTLDDKLLRRSLAMFLAQVGDDPEITAHCAKMARAYLGLGGDGQLHKDVVGAEQLATVLSIAGRAADAELFDAALARLEHTDDEEQRGNLLRILAAPLAPELAARARELALDARLRQTELSFPLFAQLAEPATREATWSWVKDHAAALIERVPPRFAASLPMLATELCDAPRTAEVRALFEPLLPKMAGGQRSLANAVEAIELCAARRDKQLPSLRAYFESVR